MRPVWIPLGDALAVIAERTGTDLAAAAEGFRAAANDGEFEVRARSDLFGDDKVFIPREAFAPWRAVFVDQGRYGVGFHFGVGTRWYGVEVRSGDIDRLSPSPQTRRSPPGRPATPRNKAAAAMLEAIDSGRFSKVDLLTMTKEALGEEFHAAPSTAWRARRKLFKG